MNPIGRPTTENTRNLVGEKFMTAAIANFSPSCRAKNYKHRFSYDSGSLAGPQLFWRLLEGPSGWFEGPSRTCAITEAEWKTDTGPNAAKLTSASRLLLRRKFAIRHILPCNALPFSACLGEAEPDPRAWSIALVQANHRVFRHRHLHQPNANLRKWRPPLFG